MKTILQILFLFIALIPMKSCTFIDTDITINVDATVMVYQDIALDILNSVDTLNIGPVPIVLGQTSSPDRIGETSIVNGEVVIILNKDFEWDKYKYSYEYVILHEHGHLQGLGHSIGIMSQYNEAVMRDYYKNRKFWVELLAKQIIDHKNNYSNN